MKYFQCKDCDCNVKGYEEIMKHNKLHLEQILERWYTEKIIDKEEERPIVLALLQGTRKSTPEKEGREEGDGQILTDETGNDTEHDRKN